MSAYLDNNKEQAFSHIDGQHYPDTYKKPNHPTFSDESIYSTKETPGGHWGHQNGKDVFYPSEWQIETFGNNYILDGMKQQGDGDVIPVRMGGVMLPEVDVHPQKFEEGGNINAGDYIDNAGTITAADTPFIDKIETAYNSPIVSIGKVFDPTGISGYPDLIFDARYFANTPVSQRTNGDYMIFATDLFGALPYVNTLKDFGTLLKLSKTRRGASGLKLIDTISKRLPGFIADLTQSDLYKNVQKDLEESKLASHKHDGTSDTQELNIPTVENGFEDWSNTNVISDLNVDSPYIKEGYTDEQINDLFKQSDWYKEYKKKRHF